MKKAWMLLPAALLAAGAAHAGTYAVVQESDCPLLSAADLSQAIRKAGLATGLDLPRDMTLRAELRCAPVGKATRGGAYVYTFRAAIEKLLMDGDMQRWAPVAQLTGYGTARGAPVLLREVQFTLADLIRQEP